MADERVDIVIGAKDLYTQHLKTAEKAFSDVGNRLATTFKVGAAALAGYSVALGAMLKTTADAGDTFHKMSQRTGVSSQTLSELAHAAELSGSSIDNVEAGFRVLSKRMLDAQNGLTTAERTFDTLGISTSTATGHLRSADAVFMDAVRSINALSSETEKAALAQELFGKSGTQLLPLIRSGAAGIAQMREEARRLGITFDDVAAARAAEFNDALTRTKGALLGVRNTIAFEFMPTVTGIAEAVNGEFMDMRTSGELDKWAKQTSETALTAFEGIAIGAAGAADLAVPLIRGIWNEGIEPTYNKFQELPDVIKQIGLVGFLAVGMRGKAVLLGTLWLMGKLEEAGENAKRFSSVIGTDVRKGAEGANKPVLEFNSNLERLAKNTGDIPENMRAYVRALEAGSKIKVSDVLGGPEQENPIVGGLTKLPDPDSYTGKAMSFFEEVRERLNQRLAAGAAGGGAKGGDSAEIIDKVVSAQMLAREKLGALVDPTIMAPVDEFSRAWLGYRANLDALERYNTEKLSLMVQAGASQSQLEAVYTQMTIDNERKKRDFQLTAASETFGGMSNIMQNLMVATGSRNKTMFKAMQGFAIAESLINTYQGATKAFATVPYPFNFVASASVIAAGMAQVAKIRSQSPEGGGGAISAGGAAAPDYRGGSPGAYPMPTRAAETRQNLAVTINVSALDPSSVNWDNLMEKQIAPALERLSGDRDVALNIKLASR